jgi:hypothetical protein
MPPGVCCLTLANQDEKKGRWPCAALYSGMEWQDAHTQMVADSTAGWFVSGICMIKLGGTPPGGLTVVLGLCCGQQGVCCTEEIRYASWTQPAWHQHCFSRCLHTTGAAECLQGLHEPTCCGSCCGSCCGCSSTSCCWSKLLLLRQGTSWKKGL